MALAERRADVVWNGNLLHGHGQFTVGSGALGTQDVSWSARTDSSGSNTTPEELIAAAQASCYAMAFSATLTGKGHEPEQLNVACTCTFDMVDGAPKVTTLNIDVRGRVPGIDAATFDQFAQEAEKGCPVANAFRGNVPINVTSTLE